MQYDDGELMVVIDGVRWRREDAERKGLLQAPEPEVPKKDAEPKARTAPNKARTAENKGD